MKKKKTKKIIKKIKNKIWEAFADYILIIGYITFIFAPGFIIILELSKKYSQPTGIGQLIGWFIIMGGMIILAFITGLYLKLINYLTKK